MTAFLPQQDRHGDRRRASLSQAQAEYRFSYTHVSPLAMVEDLPVNDEFTFGWLTAVAARAFTGLANASALGKFEIEFNEDQLESTGLQLLASLENDGFASLRRTVAKALRFELRLGAEAKRPEKIEDYANLFQSIGLPPVARELGRDDVFAAMRVAGPNPLMLQRMTSRDERFPVTDADLRTVAPADSLDAALQEGRLYLADYAPLDGVECGTFPHGQKYLYAPLAMFVVDARSRRLLPVAIQCQQKPGPGNPIFNPRDGWNWKLAKTIVEIADGNVHEAVAHLGRTHLLMEPFVVATHRQLAKNHPLYQLLTPHFQGTLAINEQAWQELIADRGGVDKLLGGTIQESRRLAVEAVTSARFDELLLPASFAARGVDDSSCFPNYPYRDDALLYWNAIHHWVDEYTALFYSNDSDVAEDGELQAWYTELRSRDGGRIGGLGRESTLGRRRYLVDVLTTILFTCSVQHAAVNFPQYDVMSYAPQMPLAGYAPAPVSKQGGTEADFLAMLPPLDMAELQMNLGFLLGGVRYTTLGDYEPDHFTEPRVAGPLSQFQRKIREIGSVIQQRNAERRPYEFLVPGGIPQSINI